MSPITTLSWFAGKTTSKWNELSDYRAAGKRSIQAYNRAKLKDPSIASSGWDKLQEGLVEVKYDPTLSLPRCSEMTVPQQLFMKMNDFPQSWINVPPLSAEASASLVGLPTAASSLLQERASEEGILLTASGGLDLTQPLDKIRLYDRLEKEISIRQEAVVDCITYMHQSNLLRSGRIKGTEKKIDLTAMQFAILCGFNGASGFGLEITTQKGTLKFLGKKSTSEGDVYVCESASKDLVLIFEDKITMNKKGAMPQIFGELFLLHYLNLHRHRDDKTRSVYAVRLFYNSFAAFALDASASQVKAIADGKKEKMKKLDKLVLRSSIYDPHLNEGLNLCLKADRQSASELMSSLRNRLGTKAKAAVGPKTT